MPTYRKLTAGDVDSSAPSPGTNPSRRVWSAVAAALMGKRCICSHNAPRQRAATSSQLPAYPNVSTRQVSKPRASRIACARTSCRAIGRLGTTRPRGEEPKTEPAQGCAYKAQLRSAPAIALFATASAVSLVWATSPHKFIAEGRDRNAARNVYWYGEELRNRVCKRHDARGDRRAGARLRACPGADR